MLVRPHVSELSSFTWPATKSIGTRPKRSQIASKSEDMGCVAISNSAHLKRPFLRTNQELPDLDRDGWANPGKMSMSNKFQRTGVLDRLNKASSAEEIFALLGVDYDPKIVNVARLHILKRMGQHLAKEQFAGAAEVEIAARCKAMLEQAYAEFVVSSPIDQRVFKVLKDAVAEPKKPAAFVPLSALK